MKARLAPLVKTLVSLRGLLGITLIASLIWGGWPIWTEMVDRWTNDPRYAHGYLVPIFSAVLLWLRRDRLPEVGSPSWWGLPILLAGLGLQLAGAYFFLAWVQAVALLPCLAGLAVLLGGWPALRWSWPAIAFLVFMVPLPHRIEGQMSYPLQRVGTVASTFAMKTVGLPAVAEGNIIHLDDVEIGVVEACSGLGMLFTFVAMSAGVAMLIRRPLLDRILILLSAPLIAIAVNVLRITTTGIMHRLASREFAEHFFHDLAGWLMMPAALGLMAIQLWFLSRLLVEVEASDAIGAALRAPGRGRSGRPEFGVSPIVVNRPTKA